MEKLISLIFTLVGLYPQYRTVQTVLRGRGLLPGDWRREHKFNNLNIYMIEPLCESMLQVITQTVRGTEDYDDFHLSGLCSVYNSVRRRGPRSGTKCKRFYNHKIVFMKVLQSILQKNPWTFPTCCTTKEQITKSFTISSSSPPQYWAWAWSWARFSPGERIQSSRYWNLSPSSRYLSSSWWSSTSTFVPLYLVVFTN